jgi:hypothetical protein
MPASAADFEFYHDVDDEYPIGQGSVAESSTGPYPSVGPSNRVRQLRGQPKPVIKAASAKATSNTRRSNPRKRRHSDDKNTTRQSRKPLAARDKGKDKDKDKDVAIAVDSESEMDGMMDDEVGTGTDADSGDDVLSIQDKSVSRRRFI